MKNLVSNIEKFYNRISDIVTLLSYNTLAGSFWQDKDQMVLVLQMGKVSSSSIYATIRGNGGIAVFQFHHSRGINSKRFDGGLVRRIYLKSRPFLHELTGSLVKKRINDIAIPVKFVVTVREPVSRNISAYFHNRTRFRRQEAEEQGSATDRARQAFLRCYPHDLPLSWFDVELRPLTGVDVFSYPFDPKKGYGVLKSDRYDILLMHHDLAEKDMLDAINGFLGTELKAIVQENVGEAKKYASEYGEFKSTAKLPKSYVLSMLNSRYDRHFFSLERRHKAACAWSDEEIEMRELCQEQDRDE